MAKLTRKELKTDKFVLEVEHGVEFFSEHRQNIIRWGSIGLGLLVAIIGIALYRSHQHTARQEALHAAMDIQNSQVGNAPSEFIVSFPTAAERDKAVKKAFSDLAAKYSGSDEATIAEFFLGTNAADDGNLAEAEKHFKAAADSGSGPYVSVAKLSLAQVYAGEGKTQDGVKLLQSIIDNSNPGFFRRLFYSYFPGRDSTVLVSKEEATLVLGQMLESSDPQRARKLLEPLRNSTHPNVSKAAITAVGQLPAQK